MSRLAQFLSTLGTVALALTLLAGGLGAYTVRRSFPQTSGTLTVPGLRERVEILRDSFGIPHLYAANPHDLFLAQGYVHAQDRFYQMDFWRHITAGRLSELYGESQLETDIFLRTLGWARVAQQEYERSDPETKSVLDAYAAGVNAYIGSRPAADLSLEYTLLGLSGLRDYRPEPWTPVHSLAWAKSMAWDLGGNMDEEIQRAVLLATLGPDRTQDYKPLYPADHPVIVPHPGGASGGVPGGPAERVGLTIGLDYAGLQQRLDALKSLLGTTSEGLGSNSWVIAGSRTTTGRPLLANDTHLAIQMPAIWYEVGLHCRPLSAACPYDVVGFSLAGDPGVIIGHNQRIAWGFTNINPDVQDLYIERLNPANPNQYEVNGQWVDMTVLQETIKVKGGADVPVSLRYTRHGPVVSEAYGEARSLVEKGVPIEGITLDARYALALRWTALEPTFMFRAVLQLNRAQNWRDFRAALEAWSVPAQNAIYADVDGNIGYQMPGRVPIRRSGDGLLPVPGWTDDYEWTGYIPFRELPFAFNPSEGYIVTANNAVVGPNYPYLIQLGWDEGYRAQRIVEMIEARPQISPAYMQQMQGDNLNLGAREVLPYLLALSFEDPKLAQGLDRLRGWDYQMDLRSSPAALYMAFFNDLLAEAFYDQAPQDYWFTGDSTSWLVVRNLLERPNDGWWDDVTTPVVEARDDILRRAFAEGYVSLEARLGDDPDAWRWGALHTSTFVNQTLGRSGTRPIEALFNRGPFPTAGGSSIVNATGLNLNRDDQEVPGDPYAVRSLPSQRMVVDLGDLESSVAIHTTGQSGHAFHPHYIDMAERWRLIQYHPMLWSRPAVEAQAEALLTLVP